MSGEKDACIAFAGFRNINRDRNDDMPRLSGVNIPDNKKIDIALTYIYGIGPTLAKLVLKTTGVNSDRLAKDLTSDEINKIQGVIDKNYRVEGELRREILENVKRLKETGSWKGGRHMRKLPLHGRTRTNSRTLRGNIRKTMGSGKRPPATPT
ncbi:MAG: small subunit ribosomal protein S13 [Parcubacteria group bacterium Gr01-1014_2]|nr:MAG: small subunit ribosomal protein S13 [Parcubacteria group bacterium Gr01-1014_2]